MTDTQTSTAFYIMAKHLNTEGARQGCCAQKTQPHLVHFLAFNCSCCMCCALPLRQQRDIIHFCGTFAELLRVMLSIVRMGRFHLIADQASSNCRAAF